MRNVGRERRGSSFLCKPMYIIVDDRSLSLYIMKESLFRSNVLSSEIRANSSKAFAYCVCPSFNGTCNAPPSANTLINNSNGMWCFVVYWKMYVAYEISSSTLSFQPNPRSAPKERQIVQL